MSKRDTVKRSVTLPEQTIEWLREQYPDAKSDAEAIIQAISDARKLHKILEARRVAEVEVEEDLDADSDGSD